MKCIIAIVGFRGAVRRSMGCLAIAVMAGAAVAGCDSPVDVRPHTYGLDRVNGEALPAPYPEPFLYPHGQEPQNSAFRVSFGTLSLHDNGTVNMTLVMRCASPPPAGTQCEVEGDGRNVYSGSYATEGDFIEIEGRQYPVEFDADRVEITIRLPPSMGLWPVFALEFRRYPW